MFVTVCWPLLGLCSYFILFHFISFFPFSISVALVLAQFLAFWRHKYAWQWAEQRAVGAGGGCKVTGKSGATVALECHLSKELPGNLHNYKRTCKRNAVSACPQFPLQRFSALAFLWFLHILGVLFLGDFSTRPFQFFPYFPLCRPWPQNASYQLSAISVLFQLKNEVRYDELQNTSTVNFGCRVRVYEIHRRSRQFRLLNIIRGGCAVRMAWQHVAKGEKVLF